MSDIGIKTFLENSLYYLKCLYYTVENAKSTINKGLHHTDKYKINEALKKIEGAKKDILFIVKNPDVKRSIEEYVDNTDFTNYMVLVESLFRLKEEHLDNIADLIEAYQKQVEMLVTLRNKSFDDKPLSFYDDCMDISEENIRKSFFLLDEALTYLKTINKHNIVVDNTELAAKIQNLLETFKN